MTPYSVEIRENSSGDVRRVHMAWEPGAYSVGWADGESGSMYTWKHGNCDCNLHALWAAAKDQSPSFMGCYRIPLTRVPFSCEHTMPPQRYTALRAFVEGRVIDLQTGDEARAA